MSNLRLGIGGILRFALAAVVCSIALILPYRLRVAYGQAVAFIAHLPFIVFGRLARFLLRELEAPRAPPA